MSKKMLLEINPEIKQKLASKNIDLNDGVSCLLIFYYGLTPKFVPEILETKVLSCNIIKKDYITGELVWKIDLFEESIKGFEWVSDFMDLFKQVNPERRGIKASVMSRMKSFFSNNPSIRKDEVMEATKHYLGTIKDPTYCKMSHKFIKEQDGTSMLLDFIESIESTRKSMKYRNDDII